MTGCQDLRHRGSFYAANCANIQTRCNIQPSFIHKYNWPYPFQLASITSLTLHLFQMCNFTALIAIISLHVNRLASLLLCIYRIFLT